jgi:predicted dehydrogenase
MTDGIVRVGVIGTSWWTDLMYVPSLTSHPRAKVTAVCGRDRGRAQAIADKLEGARVFADYREMLAAEICDAVAIVTPDDLHCDMALAAIGAGKHVLCEKPLACTAADARRMQQAATAAGVKNMVLFTWRWQPHWRYVKRLIDEGYIGHCWHAEFRFLNSAALGGRYQWRFDGARANGIVGDLGSHMIDFVRWYLGDIASVRADIRTFVPIAAGPVGEAVVPGNDFGALTMELVSGGRADVTVSGVNRVGDEVSRITAAFHGSDGSIEVVHPLLGAHASGAIRGMRDGETSLQSLAVPADLLEGGIDPSMLMDPYVKQSAGARRFIDAILGRAEIDTDFEVGLRVQEVVDAALLSAREGRTVRLDG